MSSPPISKLQERVTSCAESILRRKKSVGPIDLLQEMRLLSPVHVENWRQGRERAGVLETFIQAGPDKLAKTQAHFAQWAKERGLRSIDVNYTRTGVQGLEPLQLTADRNPQREQFYRTHYTAGDLSEAKQQKLTEKLNQAPDLVAVRLATDSAKCSECGAELGKGVHVLMEKGAPVCLACTDMDHLVVVPSGNAALSRRSRKYSPLAAVILHFNRSRKRYEREGILVTPEALDRALAECEEDAAVRAGRCLRDAERRSLQDSRLVEEMVQLILARYPSCPADNARRIAEHTAVRGSGRVGRSAAGRALEAEAIDLAVIASIRHEHTDYDTLLMQGVDRAEARQRIRARIDAVLASWRAE